MKLRAPSTNSKDAPDRHNRQTEVYLCPFVS